MAEQYILTNTALIEELKRGQEELKTQIRQLLDKQTSPSKEGWMDTKEAINYLGISKATFEKYLYKSKVKIKGYKLDGKTLFKREDLDNFVKLYEVKTSLK